MEGGARSAYLISSGDPVGAAFLRFGDPALRGHDFAIFFLHGYNWPMAIRFNFDVAGRVTAIFIYRTDI